MCSWKMSDGMSRETGNRVVKVGTGGFEENIVIANGFGEVAEAHDRKGGGVNGCRNISKLKWHHNRINFHKSNVQVPTQCSKIG